MAISGITARGTTTQTGNGTTVVINPTANLVVDRVVIACFGGDNTVTADGDSNNITIADSKGNVWAKIYEKTETDGVASDGATIAMFICRVTTQINTTDTITFTHPSTGDRIGCIIEATVAAGNTLLSAALGVGQNAITATIASLTSREYLFVGWAAAEGEDNAKTPDANYVEQYDLLSTTAGNLDANISVHLQTRVVTATSQTCTSTAWTFTNAIMVLAALYEAPAPILFTADGADLGVNSPLTQVGNSFSLVQNASANTEMCGMTSSRIALWYDADAALPELRAYDWNGTDWSFTGSALTGLGLVGGISLTKLSSTEVVISASENFDNVRVYNFNGSAWSQVGNALSIISNTLTSAALSATRIAVMYENLGNVFLRAYDWDGTNFTLVGNELDLGVTGNAYRLCPLNGNAVITYDGNTSIKAYTFDGTNWTAQGSVTEAATGTFIRYAPISATQFLVVHQDDYIRRYRFDGTSITLEHTHAQALATASIGWMGSDLLAFYHVADDLLRTYEYKIWGNADFSVITTPGGGTQVNGQFFQFF